VNEMTWWELFQAIYSFSPRLPIEITFPTNLLISPDHPPNFEAISWACDASNEANNNHTTFPSLAHSIRHSPAQHIINIPTMKLIPFLLTVVILCLATAMAIPVSDLVARVEFAFDRFAPLNVPEQADGPI
ncbi:hypothetical protein EV182_003098, partial [Spiromyces aspiralis]